VLSAGRRVPSSTWAPGALGKSSTRRLYGSCATSMEHLASHEHGALRHEHGAPRSLDPERLLRAARGMPEPRDVLGLEHLSTLRLEPMVEPMVAWSPWSLGAHGPRCHDQGHQACTMAGPFAPAPWGH
jgi:hypothetical protein